MENIGTPQNTIAIIQKYNFNFQKKFGQNFLIDTHVLNKIISGADIHSDDCVIEIGPGIGTLTSLIAANAKKVIAVEIDKNLIPILEDTLKEFENITIINEDILKLDISNLALQYNEGKAIKVVANLPYYITTPIIMGLFESHVPIESITVMIQKEVADRIQAGPGTKNYGALSLAVQYYSKPELIANVPQNCFIPRPGVGSAVIKLNAHKKAPYPVDDEALLFKLIRAAFMQRRKTLQNSVCNSNELHLGKDSICLALEQMKLDVNIRGEALNLQQFCELSNILGKSG
jgi:dimethyladenosine transferase